MAEITITVSEELRAELECRITDTEFESLEEYIRFVLEAIVEDESAQSDPRDVDQTDLEDRLEDLGYL
jgi:Arc/MetJ-type ribon-helix-helix transcriptional regulator